MHELAREVWADVEQATVLKRELRQREKELEEALALLRLVERAQGPRTGQRGRLHGPQERQRVRVLVEEALAGGARLSKACRLVGISARTFQRWRNPWHAEDRRARARRQPANRLSEHERLQALQLLHSAKYRGMSPRQLVPRLADQGIYVASESTLYRLLRAQPRRDPRPRPWSRSPPSHLATAPNQIWSWDITYLRGPARGRFLYLYLVMDIFSRRIMGWQVHQKETAEHAARLIRGTCERHALDPAGLVLRSDNGRPMRGETLRKTLRSMGILPCFSRPGVSNDNPFSEALFRTIKSRPGLPSEGFDSLARARAWARHFVAWYNTQHLHSGLQFLTPDDRYFGREDSRLSRRREIYERAWLSRPERWSRRPRRWWSAGPTPLAFCATTCLTPTAPPERRDTSPWTPASPRSPVSG
ncbi:IS3 family transposase [Archangium violaceum]|uniref:IS3 family transposase n=1 Tax=Archangium violaceum TaxID=83451 RepID=UPI002B2BAB85|nr:IS3 family transposase [Archangium gephyra]